MARRGYIGAITSSVQTETLPVSPTVETDPVALRSRLEGENSTVKPEPPIETGDTANRGVYFGSIVSSGPLDTTFVAVSAIINPIVRRRRLKGDNSIIKPLIAEVIVVGISKKRLYYGAITPTTTTFDEFVIIIPPVDPVTLRLRLRGDNSTIKPLVVDMPDEPLGDCPPNRRIYVGGEFFTGNISCSPGFSEWDPTTLTEAALKDMQRYWGVSLSLSITGNEMQALPNYVKVYTDEHNFSYVTTGGYLYYAHPKPLGTPTIYVNGFLNTAWVTSEVTVLENGVYVIYVIYRSIYKQNGSNIQIKIDLPL